MAIIVEHDKRKQEILEKSLDLFCREGYDDVTFQKIADACGITRTTLYIYFKNKREVFIWSIKLLTSSIEKKLMEIIRNKSLDPIQRLKQVLYWIVDSCEENRQLFNVLLPYLISLQKSGIDPGERVKRRVIRIKHLLSTMIINGQKQGCIKKIAVKDANDLLYGLIETAIFRIAVLNQTDISDVKNLLNLSIEGITEKKSEDE